MEGKIHKEDQLLPEHFNHKRHMEKLQLARPSQFLYQLVVDIR